MELISTKSIASEASVKERLKDGLLRVLGGTTVAPEEFDQYAIELYKKSVELHVHCSALDPAKVKALKKNLLTAGSGAHVVSQVADLLGLIAKPDRKTLNPSLSQIRKQLEQDVGITGPPNLMQDRLRVRLGIPRSGYSANPNQTNPPAKERRRK